jgi:hypothetical protein
MSKRRWLAATFASLALTPVLIFGVADPASADCMTVNINGKIVVICNG